MGNFTEILNKPMSEIERPQPYPIGSYAFVVKEYKLQEVGDNQSPVVEFTLNLVQPLDDVDQQALQEYTSKFGSFPKPQRHAFFIQNQDGTPNLWRLKQFLTETLGLPDDDRNVMQVLPDTVNRQGAAKITHKPGKTGGELYAQIESTFAL